MFIAMIFPLFLQKLLLIRKKKNQDQLQFNNLILNFYNF
jgi:hypothetical protein